MSVLLLVSFSFTATLSSGLALVRLDCMPDLLAVDGASLRRWRKGQQILEGDTCGKEKGLIARDQLV